MGQAFFTRRKGTSAGPALLYYDARCGFCIGLARWMGRLDLFHALEFRSTLDTPARQVGLDQGQLDRAVCLVTPAGATYQGFYAFRRLVIHLPVLWPLAPLLWLPGMAFWGVRLYGWVADHRAAIAGCRRCGTPASF